MKERYNSFRTDNKSIIPCEQRNHTKDKSAINFPQVNINVVHKNIRSSTDNCQDSCLVQADDRNLPQRTINYSCNKLNEPVMTSRQLAIKSKVSEHPHYSNSQQDAVRFAQQASDFKSLPHHTSIYQQFHSAVRSNYDLEHALKLYYQKLSPSQVRAGDAYSKEFIPLEGVSLSIGQRKGLYAASFKKPPADRNYKGDPNVMQNAANSSKTVIEQGKRQTPSYGTNQRNPSMKRHQSKGKVDNRLCVYGNNRISNYA